VLIMRAFSAFGILRAVFDAGASLDTVALWR
jgi:hypothetical protein